MGLADDLGTGERARSLEDKRRLWEGVFSYDLNLFSPGGPDRYPDTCFVEIDPERALLLRRFGMDGREEWEAV